MGLVLLLSLLTLTLASAVSKEDYCSKFSQSCETCIKAGNISMGVLCYSCGDECKPVDFKGLISSSCELSQSHIWTCSISGLGVVILLGMSSLCVCCVCCGFSCFLCLCCISACKKRKYTQIENQEARVRLIGEERETKKENRKSRTRMIMEKYGQAV